MARRTQQTKEWHIRIGGRCREFGMTLEQIGEGLGTSYNTAYRDLVDARKEYDRLYRQAKVKPMIAYRVRVLQRYKEMKGCADCGYNTNGVALQFDHLPKFDKSFDISKTLGRSFESIMNEIYKCEVVCANCHAIRTQERRGLTHD